MSTTSSTTTSTTPEQTKSDATKKPPVRLLRRLLRFLTPYRWWLALGLVITVFSSALGPLRPRLVQMG
ncbi:MAG: hypothetical protein ACKOAG_01235, partial [Candidatus Kapaibacterium sp.]